MSLGHLARIEIGYHPELPISTVEKLSRALQVTVAKLLT
jgi:hypothetical protein